MMNANLAKIIKKFPLLTPEQEKDLIDQYVATRSFEIRNKLVNHNLRLVIFFIQKEIRDFQNEDLFNEGTIGLMRGVELFDPTKCFKFSTYVSYWIKAYILRHLVENGKSLVRLPEKLHFQFLKIKKLKRDGQEITSDWINEQLKCGTSRAKSIENLSHHNFSHRIGNKRFELSELDELDCLEAEGPSAEEQVSDAQILFRLKSFPNFLSSKEKIVYQDRILEEKTLQEVGNKLSSTREYARQIETQVKDKFQRFCLREIKGIQRRNLNG